MIKLNFNSYFENGVLYHGWTQGFFSNVSTCLWNLCQLKDQHGIEPERIDFSHAFTAYKTKSDTDIYPILFRVQRSSATYSKPRILNHHALYRNEDLVPLQYFVNKYFLLADPVMELQRKLCAKYNIDVQNTLVVCMRGTDKCIEIQSANPEAYFLQCEKVLKQNPGLKIWVQTDQKQYLDYFFGKYSDKVFFISELPMVTKNKAVHMDNSIETNRVKFAQQLLAVIHLAAQCKSVVTHTGNCGYWLALYRGHLDDFYQDITHFCHDGTLVSKIQKSFYRLSYWRRSRLANWWLVRAMLRMSKGSFSEGSTNNG
jgi:hypothetical protein